MNKIILSFTLVLALLQGCRGSKDWTVQCTEGSSESYVLAQKLSLEEADYVTKAFKVLSPEASCDNSSQELEVTTESHQAQWSFACGNSAKFTMDDEFPEVLRAINKVRGDRPLDDCEVSRIPTVFYDREDMGLD